jgi:hypothetical protein
LEIGFKHSNGSALVVNGLLLPIVKHANAVIVRKVITGVIKSKSADCKAAADRGLRALAFNYQLNGIEKPKGTFG